MKNKLLCIYFAYQFTKNMKYIGPKGSVKIKYQNTNKSLIMHAIDSINKSFSNYDISHKVVVGFEADKLLKSIDDNNVTYSIVLDHKDTNHGKILKDILLKYDASQYSGCIIISDISVLLNKKQDIDIENNYIYYTNQKDMDGNNTCNIIDNTVEHITYDTSNNYWTGICYVSNSIIRLIKHINLVYFTDPLFLMEIINQTIGSGAKFHGYALLNKDFTYIKNSTIKKIKVN